MKLLKNLLEFTYYFFNIILIVIIFVILNIWFDWIPSLNNHLKQDYNSLYFFFISFAVEIISFILFIKIIKLMKETVSEFINKKYFILENAIRIKLIGKLFLVTYFLDEWILKYILPFVDSIEDFKIEFEFVEFFTIATYKFFIGLFLLGVGKAFKLGMIQKEENIELKQENELTI